MYCGCASYVLAKLGLSPGYVGCPASGKYCYPLARMRSKGYSSRLVCLSFVHSFVLSVSLLEGSVSVHSASTRTQIAFIGHENHTKLNRFSS